MNQNYGLFDNSVESKKALRLEIRESSAHNVPKPPNNKLLSVLTNW